jgi:hypothetical protein
MFARIEVVASASITLPVISLFGVCWMGDEKNRSDETAKDSFRGRGGCECGAVGRRRAASSRAVGSAA